MYILLWSIVIGLSLIVEFFSFEMISIWFCVGGIVSLFLAAFGVELWIQILVFAIVSVVLVTATRPFIKKLMSKAEGKTNLELLHNQKTTLITSITDEEKGSVKVNGVIWSATSEDGQPIEKGTKVIIVENKGNTLIVKKGE